MISKHNSWALVLLLFVGATSGAEDNPFVGVWELVSVSATASDGSVDDEPYGPGPHGYITYTTGGHMSVLFSFGDRADINGSWRTAPVNDRANAFATVLGYSGTYSFDEAKVTHHITVSTDPNRVGTSINRTFKIAGDSITLTTPALNLGESAKKYSLTWRRIE